MPDLRDLDERFSSLAAHRTLLAIRNAYLSILPYVIVMAALTVVLAGKGVAALQEAGVIDIAPLAAAIFWPFVRILAFLAASPIWNQHGVPRQASVLLGALMAFAIGPALPPMPDTPIVSIGGLAYSSRRC